MLQLRLGWLCCCTLMSAKVTSVLLLKEDEDNSCTFSVMRSRIKKRKKGKYKGAFFLSLSFPNLSLSLVFITGKIWN